MATALVNGRVLTEAGFEDGLAVVLHGARIAAVQPAGGAGRRDHDVVDLEGRLVLPGFIDAQVNGGGGVLFNGKPTVESITEIGRVHRRFGTTAFLPTLVSDDLDVVAEAIAATRQAIAAGVPGVLGLHIEGPFLNQSRKGVHDASKIRDLDGEAFRLLTTPSGGKTLITLAPEKTTPGMIRALSGAGVIVSAGHSNASYAEVRAALDNGLTGFTHLFNAMSQLTVREPGVVGAALEDTESWCSIIVDGHHVDPVVLRLALRSKRADRFILVTDAMPTVGAEENSFNLLGKTIVVRDGICVDEDGTLAGSNMDMATAVRNAVGLLQVDLVTAVRMASLWPAEFLGLSHELGRIAPGYRANLVIADEAINVTETWIDGVRSGL
ncbi:MAG TPA: N-acetylglucosamine-6-phosphate deacetylase [Woeseiaceae bacterium]|nr:N-acetylglucosamine-6-phosphate deacetylase [Woeseiaceae bacterium]